eukprot:COSAG05_NODE_4442_length_1511_cov_1.296322_2_plen_220_part_00
MLPRLLLTPCHSDWWSSASAKEVRGRCARFLNKDGRHAYVINMIDMYTRYSWQRTIMLNSQGRWDQRQSVRAVQEIIDSIRDKFGVDAIPPGSQWQFDSGSEFKSGQISNNKVAEDMDATDPNLNENVVPAGNFKARIESYEPNITVVYSLPNQPDSNAVVERSNRQWRSIARQLLFNRDARPTDVKVAESSKDARKPWFAKWYGTNPRWTQRPTLRRN